MNLTLSIDDEDLQKALRRAEQLAGKADAETAATEFERLSRSAHGNLRGWKFNREELHERK